jgi:outer membrane protein W
MKTLAFVGMSALVLATAQNAFAEDRISATRTFNTAPVHALELTLAAGYSQGFGDVSKDQSASLTQMGQAGMGLQVGIGYRFDPRLMVGFYGEAAGYDPGSRVDKHGDVFSTAAGLQAQWHFIPYAQLDPWIGVGAGWRGYWVREDDSESYSLQGLDVARLQAGVDYRLAPGISLSPLLSLSVSKFFADRTPSDRDYQEIDRPTSNVFLFAGLMGRFDIGPQRTMGGRSAVASR